jgi:hypothetical protein
MHDTYLPLYMSEVLHLSNSSVSGRLCPCAPKRTPMFVLRLSLLVPSLLSFCILH